MNSVALKVVVVIVGFRNRDDIVTCLRALDSSTHTDFEVVICENGGADAFADLVVTVPSALAGGQSIQVIDAGSNLGFAGGVNVCIRARPNADAWWILNPDTAPEPEALGAMAERLVRGDCEAVGCLIYLPDGRVQSYGGWWRAWSGRPKSLGLGEPADNRVSAPAIERRQNYLNGASMLVGRRFLSVAGYMREDYFLYCEEVEWCLRALSLGLRLGFAPDARVLHQQGTTTGARGALRSRTRISIFLGERNKVLLTRDVYPRRIVFASAAILAVVFYRYASHGAWRQLVYGIEAWWAGVRDERGGHR